MAKTYYVAKNGNDSWPGTEAEPFKTIRRGVTALAVGDTLLVKNGTYVEEFDISKSGIAGAPLTIKSYPGHSPVIDGEAGVDGINSGLPAGSVAKVNPNTGAGSKYEGLIDITGSHVIFEGFEVKRSMGRGIRIYSSSSQSVENVTIRNCFVHHSRASNVLFHGSKLGSSLSINNVTVEGCRLSWSGSFFPARRSPSVVDWPGCLTFKSVNGGTVRGCEIYENWGEAILVDSNDGGSRNFLIEDNVAYDNMSSLYLHAVEGVLLQRNYLYRSSTDVQRSTPFGPTVSIAVSSAESTNYEPISTRNVKIFNNIVAGTGRALGLRGSSEKPEMSDVIISHNTLVNSNSSIIGAYVVNKKNIIFRNNIIASYEGNRLIDDGGQTRSGWTYSNNLWSAEPSALRDQRDVIGDPKLRNPNERPAAGEGDPKNYQILDGSPAIGAAFVVSEPKDDFFKNLRSGTPDIGGHEQDGSGFIQADFEATPVSGIAPLSVTFQDRSSASAPITEWLWDFGDGTISGQQNPTHVFNDGEFTVSLKVNSLAGSDTITKPGFITASQPESSLPERVTEGLQVLYLFNEGNGRTIYDVSQQGNALDLQILDLSTVNWHEEGLMITSPSMIASTNPADKIFQACLASNEITVEAWLKPVNRTQAGPARIISLSQNAHSRNVTLGQGLWGSLPSDVYDVRLRTTERSANGLPSFSTPSGFLTTEKCHVVYTRNRSGAARFFINGVQIGETIITGDFSTWNPRFPLLLANETTGDYPWLGDLYLVAIYDRALGTSEVQKNFDAGLEEKAAVAELPALLPVFKRFYISSTRENLIQGSNEPHPTFGVQYPDLRCVTCRSNGDQTLTVHDSIESTLRSYGATTSDLHWLD